MKKPNYISPGKFSTDFSNGILRSLDFNDIYFSVDDGIGEVGYVYLEANNLPDIFNKKNHTVISELGFGTGLNFLATWKLFERSNNGGILDYISIEGYPLETETIKMVHNKFPELVKYSKWLCQKLPPLWSGIHRLIFNNGQIRLTLIYDEALSALKSSNFKSDIWFLDGFNPKKNPDIWNLNILNEVFRLTKDKGTFSTFSSAGEVRSNLSQCGFIIKEVKGFGKKKEMTCGYKPGNKKPKNNNIKKVIIIGGGIAGASVARSLKSRGIEPIIIDQEKSLAMGASGNLAAIQAPRLSTVNTPSGRLSISGYRFARDLSKELDSSLDDKSYVLAIPERERSRQYKLLKQGWPKDLIREITKEDRENIFSNELYFEGIVHDYGGTIKPLKIINEMISENIEVILNSKVEQFIRNINGWEVRLHNGDKFFSDALVLCCAEGLKGFKQTSVFDLQYTQGQVTYLQEEMLKASPKCNLSFSGYITPSIDGRITVGSTFEKYNSRRYEVSEEGHKDNINKIPDYIRRNLFDDINFNNLDGKVSMRVSAYDRMPMMGLIEKDLYILSGLGSRGMVLGPLLGDSLASLICDHPIGMDNEVLKACDPNRIERSYLF